MEAYEYACRFMVDDIGSYEDTDMYMECDIPRHVKGLDNIEDDDDNEDDDEEKDDDDDDEHAEDYDGKREEEEKPEKKVTFVFPASTTIFLAVQIPLP